MQEPVSTISTTLLLERGDTAACAITLATCSRPRIRHQHQGEGMGRYFLASHWTLSCSTVGVCLQILDDARFLSACQSQKWHRFSLPCFSVSHRIPSLSHIANPPPPPFSRLPLCPCAYCSDVLWRRACQGLCFTTDKALWVVRLSHQAPGDLPGGEGVLGAERELARYLVLQAAGADLVVEARASIGLGREATKVRE